MVVRGSNGDPDLRNTKDVPDNTREIRMRHVDKGLRTRRIIGTVTYSNDPEPQEAMRSLIGERRLDASPV